MKKTGLIAAIILSALILLEGCTNVKPHFVDGETPPVSITSAPTAEVPGETPPVEDNITQLPTDVKTDALGNVIYSADHFERYVSFRNILVYEDDDETLVDCVAVNDYPETLLLAVNITFFSDGNEKIASGSLQMADGSFLLALAPGETKLYARVLTDIVLTDKSFTLTFDPETGVNPE